MARACGKVILLGEHAVVYGVPAIAAGIERGAEASAQHAEVSLLWLGEARISAADDSDLGRAFAALVRELGAAPAVVRATSELPVGAGLGSSAALGVAIARAVLELGGGGPEARVLAAASAWERVFHGNPSGIDTAAAAHGGCIWYTKQGGTEPLALGSTLTLAIAVAGPPASTKAMVESVARLGERRPEVFRKSLAGIESLVKNARLALEAGDVTGLGRLLDLNQMLLSGLMVSTEEIETACRVAREAGALGAKLTGAGGGGAVIALCEADPEPVLDAWRRQGLTCFSTRVAARVGGT
ncbi:MAG: mevalonate kinase [Polyangiaceae bacterium]|nr:mevalonate kinase [Polyangiaceae bacterium]MCL4753869.1 mevalonate kinase [Myxococcales bacterium]